MTMLPSVIPPELTLCSPPFALVDAPALVDCIDEPNGASPAPRYRRPRQCLRLSRRAPLLLRLAARGAMPSHPSLLPTIMEVDESLYLDACPNYLARSPPPHAAKCDESSRKRRTPDPEASSDPWSTTDLTNTTDLSTPRDLVWKDKYGKTTICLSAYQEPVESLQAILTPGAIEHWKRLVVRDCSGGMPCPA